MWSLRWRIRDQTQRSNGEEPCEVHAVAMWMHLKGINHSLNLPQMFKRIKIAILLLLVLRRIFIVSFPSLSSLSGEIWKNIHYISRFSRVSSGQGSGRGNANRTSYWPFVETHLHMWELVRSLNLMRHCLDLKWALNAGKSNKSQSVMSQRPNQ